MRTQIEHATPLAHRRLERAGDVDAETRDEYGSARHYDEYRVKLYKVACLTAREQREQLRLDWEARNRDRD